MSRPDWRLSRQGCSTPPRARSLSSPRPRSIWYGPAGKRFRPLLVMLAAQFGDPYAPGVVPSAVVVELTHLATLYHDDVMDEAEVRRGVDSANTRWGNSVAVLTGDFLFARASHILADLGPEAVRIQAEAFERLVTGQILETAGPQDGRDPVEHYLDVIAGKTGSLVAVSGRFGAMMSGADEAVVDILTQYGERLGAPSSSPTTCWTSPATAMSRARRRVRTCARAFRRCPSCTCARPVARPERPGADRAAGRRSHGRCPARGSATPAAGAPGAGAGPPGHCAVR